MIGRAFRQILAIVGLALVPAVVAGAIQLRWRSPEPLGAHEVTLATAQQWGDRVLWVDARPQSKYDREHIPDAVPLNEDDWEKLVPTFLDSWEPGRPIVVYCDGGACEASAAVAERLRTELKLEGVWVLKGGWTAWLQR